jgi:hypothetical protein
VVAAQAGIHACTVATTADADARRSTQRAAAIAITDPRGSGGEADRGDDEQRVRRDVAYGVAGLI